MRSAILLFISLTLSVNLFAQKESVLKRRAFMGIQMEMLSDDLRNMTGYKEGDGVYVKGVVPGSSAEAAGIRKGDILVSVNEVKVKTPAEAVSAVGRSRGGDKFTYVLYRNGKQVNGSAVYKTFPVEKYADLQIEYTQVSSVNGLQRVILSSQKEKKKRPLVVFIGGIGCYSLDNPVDTTSSELQVINTLARNGFTCARIEKPGMGDNAGQGKLCSEIGFYEEAEGYIEAIKMLKKRNDIDSSNVYIIGHSMGGLMAPLVAARTNIKGIAAYGTIGSNMLEYLVKTRRTIAQAYGWKADETDSFIKDYCECAAWYFADKMSTEEVAKKKPDCKEYLSVFDLRSRKYNEELYNMNIPSEWMKFKGASLLMWGASDFIASEEDHRILADAVNSVNPGKAKFVKVPDSTHGMETAADFMTARTSPGPFNKNVVNTMLSWLREQQ